MPGRTAIVIGAGPAGLTAAMELLDRTDVRPIVLEASGEMGGISRTVEYHGNRMDIGGHRFFSKSDRVMQWWLRVLPLQRMAGATPLTLAYQGDSRPLGGASEGPDPQDTDRVMLVRNRVSRILYQGGFYRYPLSLDLHTLRNLGLRRTMRMGASYARARLRPVPEDNLEDFYINRFGRELYTTFFEDYTEKVWGVPCREIAADWGAQRVKGLSVISAVAHAARSLVPERLRRRSTDLGQKDIETSLIEHYLYPKYGPGQMWQTVAEMVTERGGEVRTQTAVVGLELAEDETGGQRVTAVETVDQRDGSRNRLEADLVISSMPVKDLVEGMRGVEVPSDVHRIASQLPYRDFVTVGLLLRRLVIRDATGGMVPDNWIYVQDPGVRVGRLQIFNNWSPWLVADPDTVWLGMEYFANEGDTLWARTDEELKAFALSELVTLGVADERDLLDSTVIRVAKTYPAYFGTYAEFDLVRKFLDEFDNLYLVGRNGQHCYNNQDHSMLTAMEAVDNIASGREDKSNVWEVNAEPEYHESK